MPKQHDQKKWKNKASILKFSASSTSKRTLPSWRHLVRRGDEKGIFTMMKLLVAAEGNIVQHCSANVGKA